MAGALVFLFVSGGLGATALGLWFLLRRSRLRLQPAVASRAAGVRPVIRQRSAAPEDRRAGPEPADAAAPEPSGDETPADASPPAPAMPAVPNVAEAPDNPVPANVEEFVPPSLAAPEPAQDADPGSSAEASDAGTEAPVPAFGTAAEASTNPYGLGPAGAEEAILGEGRHAQTLPAAAEGADAQAGAAAPDPQPLLADTAAPGAGMPPDVDERTASGPDALAEDELPVQDMLVAEGRAAEAASGPPPAAAGAAEADAEPSPHTGDGTAALEAGCDTAPAGEFGAANGIVGQPPQLEAGGAATLRGTKAEAAASELTTDAASGSARPESAEEPDPLAWPAARPRPSKPAQHRDRRGQRRANQPQAGAGPEASESEAAAALRTPAEARLRLILHPVRRTISLAAVLARPSGYPDRITLLPGAGTELGAYSEERYDDVDLEWTPDLLSGEVRLDCKEGYQWLRSGRRVHVFSELADEPGLISVGFASVASPTAIVCRQSDEAAVRTAAAACGSPELVSHDRWAGVPEGWIVLSGYHPAHAASSPLEPGLTALDPGVGAVIRLSGGLQVRSGSFAQGSPPRIEIEPFPAGARVAIDGASAEVGEDGSWRAAGWDAPGDHLVDVVPGPSLTYRILADPWLDGGWERWDAHPERFPQSKGAPWERAQICGASLAGPSSEHVVAAVAMATVVALGLRRGAAVLQPRPDAPAVVGLLREAPAFLVSSSGPRRTQGRVAWLAPLLPSPPCRELDLQWIAAVRSAALRRLPLVGASAAGQDAWRRARERARRYRKAGT